MSTDDAADLLQQLVEEGYAVMAVDGRIRVTHPTHTLSPERKEAVRRHRAALHDLLAEATAVSVLALSPADRAAWRLEIIHALLWAAAGKRDDPHLLADLRVLRRVEGAGACLRCGVTCPDDGRFWCDGCHGRDATAME